MEFFKKRKSKINITFVNIKITVSVSDYKNKTKKYLKDNFNINNWNLKTIFHSFPFLFGFYQMINHRYNHETFLHFFENNIPAKKILKEEIDWETFNFLTAKNLKNIETKRIDIYNDCLILEFEQNKQNYSIGFFPSLQNKKETEISPRMYSVYFNNFLGVSKNTKFTNNLFNFEIFYKLDEVPIKVEKYDQPNSIKNYFFENQKKIIVNNENNLIEKTKQKDYQINYLLPKKFENINLLSKRKTYGIISFKPDAEISSSLLTKLPSRNNNKDLIQKEFTILFSKIGSSPIVERNNTSKTFLFENYSPSETLKIINPLLQKKTSIFTRKISGYLFPDSHTSDIYSLIFNQIRNQSKKNLFLKTDLPASFLEFTNNFQAFPSFTLKNFNITNRKDGFFGSNLETLLNQLKWKTSISQDINKKENLSFEEIDDSDPDSWFLLYKTKEKQKSIDFEEKNIIATHILQQIDKSKFNYHYPIFIESLFPYQFSNSSHFGEIYKKTPNLLNFFKKDTFSFKNNNFIFFESWEPISINSWMILIQFSVGLFLLQLLKDLYKDYGKELVDYVLQFASSSGIDVEEIKEQYLYDDPGYRLIKNIKKNFKDIAGIDNILPELGEIVWFLRNSGRSSKFKNSIPKGILLTGPPGTGKTLLVQAIAGEAQVPVIVESGSLLSDPQQKGRGIEKLKKIFDQARQLSPCIVFIDEVDTIGEKRQNIIQTAMGGDELIESIYEYQSIDTENKFIPNPINIDENKNQEKDLEYELFRGESSNESNFGIGQFQKNIETKKTRLSLLTQFLVEMDGLKERQGVIVIGATNRPNVLDPALIRPGRFDQILNLELPGKNKRIEILKLYSKKLKVDKNVSWNYLSNLTKGFSAADLAAAMNESAIQSILNNTKHTIETIERGIDLVTSYTNEITTFSSKEKTDPFLVSRLAYYQSGKAVLQTLLPSQPPVVVLHLQPRQKNTRHANFSEKSFSTNKSRFILEGELISFYSGKAAEILALYGKKTGTSYKRWQSDLGIEDLISGTFLANLMVDKWFFYSNKIISRKNNEIINTRNNKEFRNSEKVELIAGFKKQIENEIEVEQIAKLYRKSGYQQRGFGPWWQIQVSKQTSETDSFFAEWYRIYLPDPEESILNLEWIPPDEFFHINNSLKRISKKSISCFNDLHKIERDYIYHGLILQAFNTAFSNLEHKREFLDYFSDYLIRYNILREDQIAFFLQIKKVKKNNNKNQQKEIINVSKNWGINSRRQKARFVNLTTLKKIKDKKNYTSTFFNIETKP